MSHGIQIQCLAQSRRYGIHGTFLGTPRSASVLLPACCVPGHRTLHRCTFVLPLRPHPPRRRPHPLTSFPLLVTASPTSRAFVHLQPLHPLLTFPFPHFRRFHSVTTASPIYCALIQSQRLHSLTTCAQIRLLPHPHGPSSFILPSPIQKPFTHSHPLPMRSPATAPSPTHNAFSHSQPLRPLTTPSFTQRLPPYKAFIHPQPLHSLITRLPNGQASSHSHALQPLTAPSAVHNSFIYSQPLLPLTAPTHTYNVHPLVTASLQVTRALTTGNT